MLSKKGQPKEGLTYQLKGLEIKRGLKELNAQSYLNIAMTYRKLGDLSKEEAQLDTALIVASAERDAALQKKIWHASAQNFALQNKFRNAYSAIDSAFGYYQKEVEKTVAQLTIVYKKATEGERGVRVELMLPYQLKG